MLKKLKSTSGESIAETLVSVLIAAFALLMLAGTVNTASGLITKGQKKMSEYYNANNNLATQDTTNGTSLTSITISGNGINSSISVEGKIYKPTGESTLGSDKLMSYHVDKINDKEDTKVPGTTE